MSHKLGPPNRPLTGGMYETWDPADAARWRIYHKDWQTPDALHRRTFGPFSRFDHHLRDPSGKRRQDPSGRSVTYLGEDLRTAGAEVFWDDSPGLVARVCPRHWAAQVVPTQEIPLLTLFDEGADEIGALPELATGPSTDRDLTQEWAKAIYEDLMAVGIYYPGAHQFGPCIALFDTAPPLDYVRDTRRRRDAPLQSRGLWAKFKREYTKKSSSTAKGPIRTRRAEKISSADCPRCQALGLAFIPAQ